MTHLKEELESLNNHELSPIQSIKKKHLLHLIDILSNMTIKDIANLKRIIDLYKQPNILIN